MTLMTVFNNALKEVVPALQELENVIVTNNWSYQKKTIAVTIIRKIRNGNRFEPFKDNTDFLEFVVTMEVELEDFEEYSIVNSSITREIKEVLDDINKISPIIKFSFKEHNFKENKIIYYINWEI